METPVACIVVLTAIGSGVAQAAVPHFAFVTSTTCPGDFSQCPNAGPNTGVAAADAECASRALAAGLGGTFVAWVSTSPPLPSATDAYCHLHDLTGARSGSPGNCNVGSLPSGAGPWRRTDGSAFAATSPLLVYPDLVVYNP